MTLTTMAVEPNSQTWWQQVEHHYDRASALPAEQREGYLVEACGPDTDLMNEVASLLDTDEDVLDFMEQGLAYEDEQEALIGQTLEGYRIVRKLGSGGMGTVFLAESQDFFQDRHVAVKLLKPQLNNESWRRRFNAERRILSHLDHPNIAGLRGGGHLADGTPYLIMEYVEGEPITTFCDRRGLSVAERLRLFRKVCAAVHYSHQNLIIHRDLKPDNIFVTEAGEPKLLDFGIAKLQASHPDHQQLTTTQNRCFTPDYASPEQILGYQISPRADVYALGIVLYQLLTGFKPFSGLPGNQLLFAVCRGERTKPSEFLTTMMADPTRRVDVTRVGTARRRDVASLAEGLRGDLDAIVSKAISRVPEQRYEHVEAFGDDVLRYLLDLPVAAREENLWRRAFGWFKRQPLPLFA
ncbi:Non-specific serine/threonine protein kinase [Sulfidibacter corallicola]|uniref:Serine/threonine protein kinase n=1 Tax=Sulfidibacter corallicola TaxID=2818388 RepID=A0A8A4TGD5_SULCO|nr:serine/threonine-protein kinase [Sulfidibacter corallicola]QTD49139.1 serine/threonine protein kinase [Sulfidibacter corallicola]